MKRFAQTVKYVSGTAADFNASYAAGQGKHCERRGDAVLRVTAPVRQRAHAVPDLDARDLPACRDHLPCHFQADDRTGVGRRRVHALPLHHIGTVDARRQHADQDLVRLRLGDRTRRHAQDVGIPRPGGLDISHLIRQFHRTLLVR